MKALIVYYSYSGNTRRIAQQIQKKTGGDLAEIRTVEPYPDDYDTVVSRGKTEVDAGYMPPCLPLAVNPADYDVIYLGAPVWWYTFAPAVKTFLASHDLTGKKIYPFLTNGGWIGHTAKDIVKACPGALVGQAANIRFDGDRLTTPAGQIETWVEEMK